MYYFDDVLSENFVLQLTWKIFDTYKTILGESPEDLATFARKSFPKLSTHKEFKTLAEKLTAIDNTHIFEDIYNYNFLYYQIMNVVVNDSLLITYSNPKLLQEDIRQEIKKNYKQFKPILDKLNAEFFKPSDDVSPQEAKKLHYRFKFNNKHLIPEEGS